MSHARFVSTRSGIEIGRAYVAPPQRLNGDEEQVQRALLKRRPVVDLGGWLLLIGLAACMGVLFALLR